MSIHLVGGGWSPDDTELYDLFVAEAAVRGAAVGRGVPRIAVLIVVADDSPSAEFRDGYAGGRCEALTTIVAAGDEFDTRVLSDVDGLLVAGGLTPAYLDAVAPLIDQVRLLVADGLPYLGFSAGAMIAADRAVLGGWLIGDVPVCPEDAAEDLDEVTLADGLGLVDLAIDVHAAQWGTLTRLIAATEAGLVRGGVAIDENTALVVGEGALAVLGTGSVWRVEPQLDDDGEIVGVSVGTLGVE
jgi:cyanophycinase